MKSSSMHSRARGFTLLETMVVLVLLAILTVLIWSAFGIARRANQQGEQWNQSLNQVDAAQSYLRTALTQALPVRTSTIAAAQSGASPLPVFDGTPNSMRFIAPAPMVQESSGPKINTLRVDMQQGQRWLVLQLGTVDADGSSSAWGDPQPLAGPITQAAFAYRGTDPAGKPTGWLQQWPWPARLPREVSIAVTTAHGTQWPTMRVPLRLQSIDQQGGNP